MNTSRMIIPKRNLPEMLNIISALKSSVKFKLNLENQSKRIQKIIKLNSLPFSYEYLLLVLSPRKFRQLILSRQLENDRLLLELEVKEKTSKIYHSKELSLEDSLTPVFESMGERFDVYIELLQDINDNPLDLLLRDDYPSEDVKNLLESYRDNPPKNRLDKISLFLLMEDTLLRSKR